MANPFQAARDLMLEPYRRPARQAVTFREGLAGGEFEKWLEALGITMASQSGVRHYLRTSPVYRAINLRVEAVGKARPKVYLPDRRGDFEWVGEDDEVQQFLDRVMRGWTRNRMWQTVEMNLSIWGESYRWINKAGLRTNPRAWEIVTLHPTRTSPVVDNSVIIGYQYEPLGRPRQFLPADEVIYDRFPHPTRDHRGLAPLESAIQAANLNLNALNFVQLFFNQGINSTLMFTLGDDADPEADYGRIQAYLADHYAGVANAHRPLLMSKGTTVQGVPISNREMELIATLGISRDIVSDSFGIPGELFSGSEGRTFANRAEARRFFYTDTVSNQWAQLESELQEQLVPMLPPAYGRAIIWFDRNEVAELQETPEERRAREMAELERGVLSRNEYREDHGRGPAPDGAGDYWSAAPLGDTVLKLATLGPDSLNPPPPPEPPAPAPPDDQDDDDPPPDPDAADDPGAQQRVNLQQLSQRDMRLLNAVQRDYERLADDFEYELTDALEDLGRRAARATMDLSLGIQREPLPGDSETVDSIIGAMRIDEWETTTLVPRWNSHYESVLRSTMGSFRSTIGISFGEPDAIATRVVAAGGTNRGLIDFNAQTRQALFRSLADGREAGEGIDALSRRIRDQVSAGRYRQGAAARARSIARTETKNAQRISQIETYQASTVVTHLMAVDDQLGFGDADCSERNGKIFTFDEARVEMDLEHPGGTLDFVPVVDNDALSRLPGCA